MAITVWGVDPSITETEWSFLHKIANEGAWNETVTSDGGGLIPSPGGGTRQVSITAGDCVAAGVLGRNTAPVTVTHNANATGINRLDYVVFNINWAGTNTTGGTIIAVQGSTTTTTAPALTRVPGGTWQIPLARVTVVPGAGVFSASNIADVRPLRRRTIRYRNSPLTSQNQASGNLTFNNISVLNIADPGWPYRLRVFAQVFFTNLANDGHGRLDLSLDGATSVAESRAPRRNEGLAHLHYSSDILSGAQVVRLRMAPNNSMSGENLVLETQYSDFVVEVVPA